MVSSARRKAAKPVLAEQVFHCVARDGEAFELVARFGFPVLRAVPPPINSHAELTISFEPLARERKCGGANEFQALCLAIEFLRTTLRAFSAEGGRVYWQNTDSLVDLQSPWLGPFPSPSEFGGSWWQSQAQ